MYCDYTELSRDFTLSFRKLHQFEILSQTKKRNAAYYYWSKGLKDVIKHFGQNYDRKNGVLLKLRGPFYCGMSVILKIPQFEIFLQSPISTSKQLSVAVKFGGSQGMILELDNTDEDCREMQGMDVSWISRYREEEERLFYGCRHGALGIHDNWPLHIASVRIISSALNYQKIIPTITGFDHILSSDSNAGINEDGIKKQMARITASILDNLLYHRDRFQPFIYAPFKLLLETKTKIKINMHALSENKVDQSILELLFGEKGFKKYYHSQLYSNRRKEDEYDVIHPSYLMPDDNTNILQLSLLNRFMNVESIEINRTQNDDIYYPLSLLSLLSTLCSTKINEITIKTRYRDDDTSWILSIWEEKGKSLQQAYRNKEYCIDFISNADHRIWIRPITHIIAGFDSILSGKKSSNIQSSAVAIMEHLFFDETKDIFSSSIYESFQMFLDRKTAINFTMTHILLAHTIPVRNNHI